MGISFSLDYHVKDLQSDEKDRNIGVLQTTVAEIVTEKEHQRGSDILC